MNTLFVALRLIHILAGTLWVGAAVVTTAFLMPAATALGPEGSKSVQFVLGKQRLSNFISLSAIMTTLAGTALYWLSSGGLQPAWIFSTAGFIFTLGSITGIAAAILGGVVTAPTAARMEALSKGMQSTGAPPKPEELAQFRELQNRLGQAGFWGTVLLVVTVVMMAIG